MNIIDVMDEQLMRLDFSPSNKDNALHQIAELAANAPALEAIGADTLYNELLEREKAVTTGLGDGVAIPHARIKGLKDFVAFVLVSKRGIDFEALDKKRVHIFFVVFAPDDKVSEHLQLLAAISRLLSQPTVRKEILKAQDAGVLSEIVARSADPSSSASTQDETMKLIFVILYYEDYLQAILEFFIDQGIQGATVIESKGMGTYVSTIPLFAGMLRFMREDRSASHTLMALIPARHEQIIVQGIEKITGDLKTKQGAMLMTLDLSFHKGTMNMI